MNKSTEITVEIINWAKHQSRKDIKKLTWLKLDVNIFNDPKMYDLGTTDMLVYVYLLTLCGQSNTSTVTVKVQHCTMQLKAKYHLVIKAIEALEKIQVIQVISDISRKNPCPRLEEKREYKREYKGGDKRRVNKEGNLTDVYVKNSKDAEKNVEKNGVLAKGLLSDKNDSSFRPSEILADKIPEMWNENSGRLPKVQIPVSKIRQKKIKSAIKNHPEEKTWVEAIKRISESDFANGLNERSWVATFNWLIQPESIDKIIDGTYDNRRNLNKQEIQKIKTLRMGNPFTGKENDK